MTRIKVQNWLDAELLAGGSRQEKPRVIETDALVDTGAVKFYLKSSVIRQLGLRPIGEIRSGTMSARTETRQVFAPVLLEIQGTARDDTTSSKCLIQCQTLLARFHWRTWTGSSTAGTSD